MAYDVYMETQNPPNREWRGLGGNNEPPIGLFINDQMREIVIRFETIIGMATLHTTPMDKTLHDFCLEIDGSDGKKLHKWIHKKSIVEMTGNRSDGLHKKMVAEFKKVDAIPNISGVDIDKRTDFFVEELHNLISQHHTVLNDMIKQWIHLMNEESTPSWFETTGEFDIFDDDLKGIADNILLQNNVVDKIYDVIQLKVMAQRPKAILELLISLSSILPTPLHSLSSANPGKSKTTIGKTVYELFPKHRKIKFDKSSTLPGVLNMTKYREGGGILKNKLIRVGDFGSADEQKEAKDIISFLKVMMSEGEYDKIMTDMVDESGRAMILKLRGCGSVHMEIISPTAEAQYMSRALLWSPDDNKYVQNAIRDYQEDEVERIYKESQFKRKRLLMACVIEGMYNYVEKVLEVGEFFEILNPFTSHFNAILDVSKSPNANRDRPMIQTIPKLITLANCYKRQLFYNEDLNGYALVVSPKDYIYTAKVLGRTLSHFIHKKPEVLGTYTQVIEEHFKPDRIQTMKHTDLLRAVEGRDSELGEMLKETSFFTYQDLAKHTTVGPDSVRGHLQELEDMGLVVVDRRVKPHRLYIPSNYDQLKTKAYTGFFDYELFMEEIRRDKSEMKSVPLSLEESDLDNLYTSHIKGYETKGWVMCDVPFSVGLTGGMGKGGVLDVGL